MLREWSEVFEVRKKLNDEGQRFRVVTSLLSLERDGIDRKQF